MPGMDVSEGHGSTDARRAHGSMDATEGLLATLLAGVLALSLDASGWKSEAVTLAVVSASVSALGVLLPGSRAATALPHCSFRRAPSAGLALGSCSPVLLLSAIAAVRLRSAAPLGPLRAHFWSLIGCAVQPSLVLILPSLPARHSWFTLAVGALPSLLALGAVVPTGSDALLSYISLAAYLLVLIGALVGARGSFTLGEACTLAQGAAVLAADATLMTACAAASRSGSTAHLSPSMAALCMPRLADDMATEAALAGGLGLVCMLSIALYALRGRVPAAALAALFVGLIAVVLTAILLPWLSMLVRMDAFEFIAGALTRKGAPQMVAYWAAVTPIACHFAARVAPPQPTSAEMANPAVGHSRRGRQLLARKVFHLLAVCLFCPAIVWQLALLQHALAAALAAFGLLEIVRVFSLPPLARPLSAFLSTFLDSRDEGVLILTHTYLLLGCALPIWLHGTTPYLPRPERVPLAAAALAAAPHAGVLVLGIGDAMASIVGVYAGRTRWPHSRKTLEGSAGGAVAMLLTLALVLHVGSPAGLPGELRTWAALAGCVVAACLLEAATAQIDNLFLPLFFHTCLLGCAATALHMQ